METSLRISDYLPEQPTNKTLCDPIYHRD